MTRRIRQTTLREWFLAHMLVNALPQLTEEAEAAYKVVQTGDRRRRLKALGERFRAYADECDRLVRSDAQVREEEGAP